MIYKAVALILNNVCGIIFRKKEGNIKAGFFVSTAYTNYRFYGKILNIYLIKIIGLELETNSNRSNMRKYRFAEEQ